MSLKPIKPPTSHVNCLSKTFCRDENQARFNVPQNKIQWSIPFPEYDPDDYTMPHILKGPVWADPNIRFVFVYLNSHPSLLIGIMKFFHYFIHRIMDADIKFNAVDGKIDRRSHHGPYELDDEGSPV